MFKDQLQSLIVDAIVALTALKEADNLPAQADCGGDPGAAGRGEISNLLVKSIQLERPRLAVHGDLACSVAKIYSAIQTSGRPPIAASTFGLTRALAAQISSLLGDRPAYIEAVLCSEPSFLGFKIGPEMAAAALSQIVANLEMAALPAPDSKNFAKISDSIIYSGSLLRQAQSPRIDILKATAEPATFSEADWKHLQADWCNDQTIFLSLFRGEPGALALTLTLSFFGDYIKCDQTSYYNLGDRLRLRRYLERLSEEFDVYRQHFDPDKGFFSADLSVLKGRLGLIFATTRVFNYRAGHNTRVGRVAT